jgi:hypothetical protein
MYLKKICTDITKSLTKAIAKALIAIYALRRCDRLTLCDRAQHHK